MTIFNLGTIAERLIEDFMRNCLAVSQDLIEQTLSFPIGTRSHFSGFAVNGATSCKRLRGILIQNLAQPGGLALPDQEELVLSIHSQFLPVHARPSLMENREVFIVGLVIEITSVGEDAIDREMPSTSNTEFYMPTRSSALVEEIQSFPSCQVGVLGLKAEEDVEDETEDGNPDHDYLFVFHGIKRADDLSCMAGKLSMHLPAYNHLSVCRPPAIGALIDYKVYGNYALVLGQYRLDFN